MTFFFRHIAGDLNHHENLAKQMVRKYSHDYEKPAYFFEYHRIDRW